MSKRVANTKTIGSRVCRLHEAWLYENPEALNSVRRGLSQAKAGKISRKGPDLKVAAKQAGRAKPSDMAKSFDQLVKRTTSKKTRDRAARRTRELLCQLRRSYRR